MYLNEQYNLYHLAYNLFKENGYEILHIDNSNDELWLEKHEYKTSKVIRLFHKGFDWKNHLKTDIARVFQKTKAMEKLLVGKTIEIYNVYVSSHAPVDSWEMLKKPMQLNDKNPPKMKVYYLEETRFTEELSRLQDDIGVSTLGPIEQKSDVEMEESITYYKTQLTNSLYDKKKNIENVFSFGKPLITYVLLIINIGMFYILQTNGGSTDIENLINFGAKYNPAIIDGEWWRILTSMFLHIGFLHIFMNMLALYYLGTVVERIYGSWRFLFIYLFAGVGGGLASFAFTFNVSAGASGAIFGLFGALLFFGLIHKKIFLQTMGKGVLILVGINIVFGFVVPQIDNGAHLGGLIAGFIASAMVHLPGKKLFRMQIAALIIYMALIYGLITFGIHNSLNSVAYHLMKIEELIKDGDYKEVIIKTTNQLKNPGEFEEKLLFHRSYANIELNKLDQAIKDLEEVIQLNGNFSEAYYNIAMLYSKKGEQEKAESAVKKAYELNPKEDAYVRLYEQITGELAK